MAKRKVKRKTKQQDQPAASQSDSETDLELPLKRIKNQQSFKAELSSTPCDKQSATLQVSKCISSIENEGIVECSKLNGTGNSYEDFESFLKSYSYVSGSDSDGEAKKQIKSKKKVDSSKNVSLEDSIDYSDEAIRVISVPHKHLEIVLLQHPATLTLHGHLKVTSLFGMVSILGYKLKEGKHVKVFSTKRSSFHRVSTLKVMHQLTKESLHKKLNKLNDDGDITDFMAEVGPASVIILLEQSMLSPQLKFLELYCPLAVEVDNTSKNIKKNEFCSMKESHALSHGSDDQVVAEAVTESITTAGEAGIGHRILVCGPKQAGKSTLLRFLINHALNEIPAVYYLDTDPGQTEFTPPAVVSITKITKPLLGPPFSHRQKPIKMVFTGSCTAATSPPMYLKSIHSLIDFFSENYPKEVLFVNTMGWLQGIGEMCLQSIKKALNPTLVIDLSLQGDCPGMNVQIAKNEKSVSHIQVPIKDFPVNHPFPAKELRSFALLAYLGRCQKYYMHPIYINSLRPYCVCWDKIAVYVMGKKMQPNRLIEAIHCSFVALCYVHESLILESEKPEFPRTLSEEPINECIGFGIIRAADETNHLLYIVSPLTLDELSKVNAIIKGDTMIPHELFLKQPVSQVALPHTDQSKSAPSFARRIIKKRSFRKSIVQTPQ